MGISPFIIVLYKPNKYHVVGEDFMGELISLFTALCWTITVVSFEKAGRQVGAIAVNMIRLVIGLLFLTVFLYFSRGMAFPVDATIHTWNWLLLSGVVGLVIGDFFLFQAFIDVGGRISLVIMSFVPPLSAILGYLYFNETIGMYGIIGMTLTISAIIFVILSKNENEQHPHVIRGVLYATIGAVGQTIGLLFSKEGMGDYNAFAATQIRIISAIIGFALVLTITKKWGRVWDAFKDKKAIKYIILGSFFGPFLGIGSNLLSLQYIQMGIATTISQLNIILIIPFSIVMFKERVNMKEIIGSIVAIIGVTILFLF
jgi:drug/metabolite transporter (DMT)-like permease